MNNIANDKRTYSREGFLLADAVIAKTGPLPYTRGELGMKGGQPNDIVKINRSREVLEKALPTMIGAPITIDHPTAFIGTGDSTSHVVGSVASIPTITDDGKVKAKVRVYDADAIRMIESGQDQLSPGFNFVMQNLDDSKGTADIAAMSVNHVAIVPKGRAGEAVRIMDALPTSISLDHKESTMTIDQQQLNDAIAKAVDAAMSAKGDASQSTEATKQVFVSAIGDALKPVLDGFAEMKAAQDKAIADAKEKEAKDAADKKEQELVQSVIDGERARYAVLEDAKRMIASDKHAELDDKDVKGILAMAVGDSVADADNKSMDYLQGVFDSRKAAMDAAPTAATDTSGVPAGVVHAGGQASTSRANIYRERFNNRNKPMEGK